MMFYKIDYQQLATLLKWRLKHKCFPVNFAKLLPPIGAAEIADCVPRYVD